MVESNEGNRGIPEIEQFLLQLPSIINCKVIENDQNEIVEIHVLSNNDRSPKQIARDIQSSLIAKWNIHIDHKLISIAQIADEITQEVPPRLAIHQVEYSVDGLNARASVQLKYKESIYKGEVEGLDTRTGALILIANATIKAIEDYIGKGPCFFIEDIEITRLAKKDVMIVAVTLLTNNEERYFVGSSYIRSDTYRSVVKSTLDALNRYLEKI